ncbi:MAG TPA: phage tail protein [Burkholderiales bacterium]|nr:phage tail protein [Burkholderiales bacterium]
MISVKIDENQLQYVINGLKHIKDGAPRAISQAINRSLTHMRQIVVEEVTTQYFVRQSEMRNLIEIEPSYRTTLNGRIFLEGKPTPLIKFDLNKRRLASVKPRKKKKSKLQPLTVAVMRNGGKKTINGAFVNQTKSGYMGVFRRSTDARYPLAQLYGPSIPQMAQNLLVSDSVQEKGASYFFKRLEHEVNRINRLPDDKVLGV